MSSASKFLEFAPGMFLRMVGDEDSATEVATLLANGFVEDPDPAVSDEEDLEGGENLARVCYGGVTLVTIKGERNWLPFVLLGDTCPEMRDLSPQHSGFLWLLRIPVYTREEDDPEIPIGWLETEVDKGDSEMPAYRQKVALLVQWRQRTLATQDMRKTSGWSFASDSEDVRDDYLS